MKSSWPKQQILAQIILRLVVFSDFAQVLKKSTFCVCLPEVLDSINSQWPFFGELGG